MKHVTCDRCGKNQPCDSNREVFSFRFSCSEQTDRYTPFICVDLCPSCLEEVCAFLREKNNLLDSRSTLTLPAAQGTKPAESRHAEALLRRCLGQVSKGVDGDLHDCIDAYITACDNKEAK